MKLFNMIAAKDLERGIGKNNTMPWHCSKEYKHFLKTSSRLEDGKKPAVIFGRKSWDSIPEQFRPMEGRHNYVISSTLTVAQPGNVPVFKTLSQCMEHIDTDPEVGTVWLCGGQGIYEEGLISERLHRMYLTVIEAKFDCEVFFPSFSEDDFNIVVDPEVPQGTITENGMSWAVTVYEKK